MLRKIIGGLLVLATLLFLVSLVSGITTFVIPVSDYELPGHSRLKKGRIVNPLAHLDFTRGKWTAYLVIAPSDYRDLNPEIRKLTCFKSDDVRLFDEMKKNWNFVYTGGDVATVSSAVYFLRDGKIEFESGIVLDKNREGLQGSEYGWLEPVEKNALSSSLKRFKRVYWPVLIF